MGWLFKRKKDSNIVNDETKKIQYEQKKLDIQIEKKYVLPSVNLLKTYKKDNNIQNELENNISIIENTLSSFKIRARVIEVHIGSRYTNYELELEKGTKYNSVSTLHKEIALALITERVIITPSKKNKNAISIVVPNNNLRILSLREAMKLCEEKVDNNKLSIVLGEDMYGRIISADIREMPNLLISGSTGSGISTCVSSIIISLLLKNRPDELKFVVIDPKKIDFSDFNGLPHLLTPIVNDPKKAAIVLKKLSLEVKRRSEILEYAKMKSIVEYNEFCNNDIKYTKMPSIVVVINELADLKITSSEDIEELISNIAQLARKVGIYLLISTQRPSSNIITNTIKTNIPARIALSVPSSLDSRIILDENGAEDLNGSGEMLAKIKKGETPIRIQGCYVSDEEIKKIVYYCISQQIVNYDEVLRNDESITTYDGNLEYDDPLYNEIVEFVVSSQKASASLLQRKFKLGYNRAARIIDLLEERGIIGPQIGPNPRDVLVESKKD